MEHGAGPLRRLAFPDAWGIQRVKAWAGRPGVSRPSGGCYFATIRSLISLYMFCGTIFFCSSSSFRLYGRPSMIFLAYRSPTPGRVFNSSVEAELISTGPFFVAALPAFGGYFLLV